MDEIRAASWTELQELLFANAWQPAIRRFRSTYVFRGMADSADDLKTSLMRIGRSPEAVEDHLLRNFRRYAQRDSVPDDSVWNWLAVGQHHGLPTRLLDWTYSPYVALHFVTADLDLYDRDGAVWCVDIARTNALLPHPLQEMLDEVDAYTFTTEMLSEAADTLDDFDELAANGAFVLFFQPLSLDERITNQFALFSLMPGPALALDAWLEEQPATGCRIIVPAALKWEVRDKLDMANITERVLFPSLDGLSQWLKRYYTERTE